MNYADIHPRDVANGLGIRVSLFVSGCTRHCPGCFQPHTWDFNWGWPFEEKTMEKLVLLLNRPYIQGLTILGGEPLEPDNQETVLEIAKTVKQVYPQKDLWCYTGYTFETEVLEGAAHTAYTDALLSLIDILVDGPFIEEKKDLSLGFRGSSNQRIIDVPLSLSTGNTVMLDLPKPTRKY